MKWLHRLFHSPSRAFAKASREAFGSDEFKASINGYPPIKHINPYPWGTEAWHQCNLGIDPKSIAYVTDIVQDERGVHVSFVVPPWAHLQKEEL